MLSIISNLIIKNCKSSHPNSDSGLEEEPKLILIEEKEPVDIFKCVRALKFLVNKEVAENDIRVVKYEIRTDLNKKLSYKDFYTCRVWYTHDLIIKNNGEHQEVIIKLGDININNKKEFNKKYKNKIEKEFLMSELIFLCRLTKMDLVDKFRDLSSDDSYVKFLKVILRALNDEVFENILSQEDESIIQHFESLKTRVYQNFLMYFTINIIEFLFDQVFEFVKIVNDKGKILENKDCVLYILKEAIRRCKHKFCIKNISISKNSYIFDNKKIINCILSEINDTLNKQYPLEKGVVIEYTGYKEITGKHSENLKFEKIISELLPDYFGLIGAFIYIIDINFQQCIKTQQNLLIDCGVVIMLP